MSLCDPENGVKIIKTSSFLWLVMITCIYTIICDEIHLIGSEIYPKYTIGRHYLQCVWPC